MKCSNCNMEIDDDSQYCKYCGNKLNNGHPSANSDDKKFQLARPGYKPYYPEFAIEDDKQFIIHEDETKKKEEDEGEDEKSIHNTAHSKHNKNLITKKILLFYLIVIIVINLFFIPFRLIAVSMAMYNTRIVELENNIEYYHIYDLPEKDERVVFRKEKPYYYDKVKINYEIYNEILAIKNLIVTAIFFFLVYLVQKRKTNSIIKFLPTDIIALSGAIALFVAAFNLPYAYYTFLRVFISIISIYGIWTKYNTSKMMMVIYFISLALFNPIFLVQFDKETWRILDVIFGLIFIYLSYVPKDYKD